MNCTSVEINGRVYKQHPRPTKKSEFVFNDMFFETPEEVMVAEMLYHMDIRFMHHVNFIFYKQPQDEQPIIWCPDFVLASPCQWQGPPYNGAVTVGIEVKRTKISGKFATIANALERELDLRILLLNRAQLEPFYEERKLPMLKLAS